MHDLRVFKSSSTKVHTFLIHRFNTCRSSYIQNRLHKKLSFYSEYTKVFVYFDSLALFSVGRLSQLVLTKLRIVYTIILRLFLLHGFLDLIKTLLPGGCTFTRIGIWVSPQKHTILHSVWNFLTEFTVTFTVMSGVSPSANQSHFSFETSGWHRCKTGALAVKKLVH